MGDMVSRQGRHLEAQRDRIQMLGIGKNSQTLEDISGDMQAKTG